MNGSEKNADASSLCSPTVRLPRSILAMDWSSTAITVAELSHRRGIMKIDGRFSATWPQGVSPIETPEEAGKWLRTELNRQRIAGRTAIVSISRRDTVLRLLELPRVSEPELAPLIQNQLQARSSVAIEDLHYDYMLPPSDSDLIHALTVTAPRTIISSIDSVLHSAGIQAKLYGVGELSLGALEPLSSDDGTSLSVIANEQEFELLLMQSGIPLASHRGNVSDLLNAPTQAPLTLANRLIRGLPESIRIERFTHVSLFGTNAEALRSRFADALKVPTYTIETPCEKSTRLFALYQSLGQDSKRISFTRPRFVALQKQRDSRVRQFTLTGVVAALAMLFLVNWLSQRLDSDLAVLHRKRNQLKNDAKQIEHVPQRLAAARQFVDTPPWSVVWNSFSNVLPPTEDAYISSMEWNHSATRQPVVSIEGMARNRDVVLAMHQKLVASDFDFQPHEISRSRDERYPHLFKVTATYRHQSKDALAEDFEEGQP